MRPRSVTPQDRPAQPTHPSWHPRSGLQAHGTGGSRVPAKPGEIWEEAKGLISAPNTVPRTLNDRAKGLDVEDLSMAQILTLMEARSIKAAQLAAVCSE